MQYRRTLAPGLIKRFYVPINRFYWNRPADYGTMPDMDIHDVIKHYKTLRDASKRLKVARATIYNWATDGGIPLAMQMQIEHDTKGKLKADIADSPRREREAA